MLRIRTMARPAENRSGGADAGSGRGAPSDDVPSATKAATTTTASAASRYFLLPTSSL